MITGTIQSAVKLQFLDTDWQQKKKELNSKKPKEEMTADERKLANFQEQIEKERESNSHADTYNKLKSGGRLTAEEISYLEKNDPEALRKYREDQAEKAAYEKDLKNCKTKEDAERLKMNKLGNFAVQAKKISNDPYIPLDKKLELMNQLNDKVCLINEAHHEFIESQQYKDMPKDSEVLEETTNEALENIEAMQETVAEAVSDNELEADSNIIDNNFAKDNNLAKDNNFANDYNFAKDIDRKDMVEESVEEKMRKAESEREIFDDDVSSEDDDLFGALSKEIMSYIVTTGAGHGKIDVSL